MKWTALTEQFPQTLGLFYSGFEIELFYSEILWRLIHVVELWPRVMDSKSIIFNPPY